MRFFEYDLSVHEIGVTRLTVHLDGGDYIDTAEDVEIEDGEEPAAAVHAEAKMTTLMRYFARPLGAPFDDLKYGEYFARYKVEEVAGDTICSALFRRTILKTRIPPPVSLTLQQSQAQQEGKGEGAVRVAGLRRRR